MSDWVPDWESYKKMPMELLLAIEDQRAKVVHELATRKDLLVAASPAVFASEVGIELLGDVAERVSVGVARVCRVTPWPSKAPGAWRVAAGNSEWYIDHESLMKKIRGG